MKVVIGVPYSGAACGVSPSWALALRKLLIPEGYEIYVVKGFPIQTAREYIARLALDGGADYLLFWDADVIPEREDALLQLLSWKLPVVCGVYALKRPKGNAFPLSIFKRRDGGYEPMTWGDVPKGHRLVEIDAAGLGFCLIDTALLRRMGGRMFEWDIRPWEGEAGVSEDIWFFERVREAGVTPYADLLVTCKHVLGPGLAISPRGELEVVL